MAIVLRSAREQDLRDLQLLSSQFTLINLPNDTKALEKKIQISKDSFQQKLELKDREFLFVAEDLESERVIGSSLIISKHGTVDAPHFYFSVNKKEHFSSDLGVGFVHQVLTLKEDTDGPTEIGGLLVDSEYRRVPEKIGRQISLVRFLYMGIHPEFFDNRILCEFSPPNMIHGKSDFWESLGRRFTGLPYQEADKLSHQYKEFIRSLFPNGEIYTCLLSSAARFVLGRVGEETKPAQHLLEKIGFKYLNEVDPFDGGPHFGAEKGSIPLIQNTKKFKLKYKFNSEFKNTGLVGFMKDNEFRAIQTAFEIQNEEIILPETQRKYLTAESNADVWMTTI